MNESTMKRIAREELSAALATVREQGTAENLERLQRAYFELSRRLKVAAGKATVGGPRLGRVQLSVSIFCDPRNADRAEKELRDTVRHELAHVAAPQGSGHGPVWKRLAIMLGDSGERCHDMAVTRKARFDWDLTCSCCGEQIGTLRNRATVARYLSGRQTRCCRAKVSYRKA